MVTGAEVRAQGVVTDVGAEWLRVGIQWCTLIAVCLEEGGAGEVEGGNSTGERLSRPGQWLALCINNAPTYIAVLKVTAF